MTRGRLLAIAGLCLATALVGCPRSNLPGGGDPNVAHDPARLPGPPPWKVPPDQASRLGLAGLPPVTNAHQGSFHIHAGLRVYYDGVAVTVPKGIGLDRHDMPVSPVHTHRANGVLHIEFSEPRDFTLGQFFTLWGVSLGKASVLVDGVPVPDPDRLVLKDRQQIVVLYGTPPTGPIAWPEPAATEDPAGDEATSEPTPTPEATPSATPVEATPSVAP